MAHCSQRGREKSNPNANGGDGGGLGGPCSCVAEMGKDMLSNPTQADRRDHALLCRGNPTLGTGCRGQAVLLPVELERLSCVPKHSTVTQAVTVLKNSTALFS